MNENRTIPVTNGVFTDTFANAWTVHIYQVNDGSSPPPPPPPVDTPPTVSVSDKTATHGQVLTASSLFSASDADGDTLTQFDFWNTGTGGGHFVLNGVAQGTNQSIVVSASQLAQLSYQAGSGADTLWVRANDGTQWSSWSNSFTVTVPTPSLTVQSDGSATAGQQVPLSTLVTIADSGNVGYQKLELWDSLGTVAGGQFVVNGVAQTGGHEIDVSPANVANTVFDAGTAGGTDTLWARLLQNDNTLTAWQPFTVTVPTPTLTVQSDGSATAGQQVPLSTLVTIADSGNVGYQKLELWDSNGTVAGGQFVVNGVAQTGGHEIDVSPANIANTVFDVGTSGASDTLWARLLQNDNTLTPWQQLTVTDPVTVADGATVGLPSAYAGAVTFAGSTGTLQLEDSGAFTGTVAGLAGADTLDLRDIASASVQNPTYSGTSLGGTLALTDGIHTANIALLGNYLASTFVVASDGHGGTLITDPPPFQETPLTQPHT